MSSIPATTALVMLKNLGLNNSESRIYLFISKTGPKKASEIAILLIV